MISEKTHRATWIISRLAAFFVVSTALPASSLFLGFNALTPAQLYSTSGTYLKDMGPAGAIATFPDPTLNSYISVSPNSSFTSSTVQEFDPNFTFAVTFGINNLITDGGIYGNSLLFSAYNGVVYRVSSSGSVLNSWSTGFTHVGITSNGTSIFTTEGDSGNSIDVWSATGSSLGKIATPFVGLYGLGYDSSSGNFWASTTNFVYELSSAGSLIATFDLPGDSRTPNGAVHDSLEVGNPLTPAPPTTTPEPASILLFIGGSLMLAIYKFPKLRARLSHLVCCALCFVGISFGAVTVKLSTSVPSGAPVGTTVTISASASDSSNPKATFIYQFSIGPSGHALQVRRDFYTVNSFPWTPSDSEGLYDLEVVVHSSTGAVGMATDVFDVSSRVTGGTPVITRISHPLVALYSVPPCPAGDTARVRFKQPSQTVWQATPLKNCTGNTSSNFYVAGMRASTAYQMQQDVFHGPFATIGPVLNFTTGAVPANLPIPKYTLVKASPAPNNTAYPVLLNSPLFMLPNATDSSGALIWYLPPQTIAIDSLNRPLPGGTFFLYAHDGHTNFLREYDLAGNLVRETNAVILSKQLKARGWDPVTSLHHDTIRLPDGSIAMLGSVEKVANQGAGPVDVLGDEVIVVDPNLQLKWHWNEFDHLSITRPAVLGETCKRNQPGCPALINPAYTVANDWTHSNALAYSPSDGDLLISSRHQDWIMKARYSNGSGDGALLWRLGDEGDFRAISSDPYPWFSHQHNVEVEPSGNLSVFDNGNTRIKFHGGNSRGQAWHLDVANKDASLVTNIDAGDVAVATGSAQLLSNGNYTLDLGFITATLTKTKEFTPSGTLVMEQTAPEFSYRSFRMRSLYQEY